MEFGTTTEDDIQFSGGQMRISFDCFGLDKYGLFLRAKRIPEYRVEYDPDSESYAIVAPARFAGMIGIERPSEAVSDLPFRPHLYDDQIAVTTMALDAKRFAVWSDCGLGKSHICFEFVRQAISRTGGKALLVTLNDVVPQFIELAAEYYPDLELPRLHSRAEMIAWCKTPGPGAAITNYEKFNPKGLDGGVIPEIGTLSCICIDESSRLKGGGDSKQKKVINASCKGIEYKLSCTATPAPNEAIEYTSQAAFLEKVKTDADIIWTYFTRDTASHRRTVRPHARAAFFEFMASWSVYLKNPKRFGWRMDLPDVPDPIYIDHLIPCTDAQRDEARRVVTDKVGNGLLFLSRETNAIERLKLAQIARGFRYVKGARKGLRKVRSIESLKPSFVADLARSEMADGHQVLLWTTFDEESAILARLLDNDESGRSGVVLLTGATEPARRIEILNQFRSGEIRCLISRPKMLGYGLNFQHCSSMIFSGFSESFEELYQAIRRAVRHGQTKRVRVHFPFVEELEGETLANLRRKAGDHERATAEMEDNYLKSFLALQGKDV